MRESRRQWFPYFLIFAIHPPCFAVVFEQQDYYSPPNSKPTFCMEEDSPLLLLYFLPLSIIQ